MTNNIVINSSDWRMSDIDTVFGPLEESDTVLYIEADSIQHLMIQLKIYKTTSEAKRAGRFGSLPKGYTELRASKRVPTLYLWNPTQL